MLYSFTHTATVGVKGLKSLAANNIITNIYGFYQFMFKYEWSRRLRRRCHALAVTRLYLLVYSLMLSWYRDSQWNISSSFWCIIRLLHHANSYT